MAVLYADRNLAFIEIISDDVAQHLHTYLTYDDDTVLRRVDADYIVYLRRFWTGYQNDPMVVKFKEACQKVCPEALRNPGNPSNVKFPQPYKWTAD